MYVVKMTLFNALQPRTAFLIRLAPCVSQLFAVAVAAWQGESVCVAKSHCERPPCPRPDQTCHLFNGYYISAPLFMLSSGALLYLPIPPLLHSLYVKLLCNWSYYTSARLRKMHEFIKLFFPHNKRIK